MLCASFEATNPGKKLRAYCLGWGDQELRLMQERYPFEFVHVPLNSEVQDDLSRYNRSGSCLKLKALFYRQFAQDAGRSPLWVDADSVVLKSIDPFFEVGESGRFDAMLTHVRLPLYRVPYMVFALGVMYFAPTKVGREFLDRFVEESRMVSGLPKLTNTDMPWFQDQIAIYKAFTWMMTKNQIPRVYPLGEEEHSIECSPDTIVFSKRKKCKQLVIQRILDDRGIRYLRF